MGEERQQMTEAQPTARDRKMFFTSSSRAYASDFPSMIRAKASDLDLESDDLPSVICCTTLAFDACNTARRK